MEMIAEVEAEQTTMAAAQYGGATRLARLCGIGIMFATVLDNDLLFRDFCNRHEVGGDLGLTPSPWHSGGARPDQDIVKSGNPISTACPPAFTSPGAR